MSKKGMELWSGVQSITECRNHLLNHMDLLVLQFVCSLQASIRTYFDMLESQGTNVIRNWLGKKRIFWKTFASKKRKKYLHWYKISDRLKVITQIFLCVLFITRLCAAPIVKLVNNVVISTFSFSVLMLVSRSSFSYSDWVAVYGMNSLLLVSAWPRIRGKKVTQKKGGEATAK